MFHNAPFSLLFSQLHINGNVRIMYIDNLIMSVIIYQTNDFNKSILLANECDFLK